MGAYIGEIEAKLLVGFVCLCTLVASYSVLPHLLEANIPKPYSTNASIMHKQKRTMEAKPPKKPLKYNIDVPTNWLSGRRSASNAHILAAQYFRFRIYLDYF